MRWDNGWEIQPRLRVGVVIAVVGDYVVDVDDSIFDVHFVAGQSDDSFDDHFIAVLLRFEYDDVAAFRPSEKEIGSSVKRYSPESDPSESVDEDAVVLDQSGFHAWAVYSVGNGYGADKNEYQSEDDDHLREFTDLRPDVLRHNVSNSIAIVPRYDSEEFECRRRNI